MKKIISKFSLLLTCLLLLSCGGSTDSSRQVDSSGQQINVPPPISLDTNTATFNGIRANFNISKSDLGYAIANNLDGSVIDVPISVKSMVFDDLSVNLEMNAIAQSVSPADLKLLVELYVAFFNRVPEADGLSYWITEKKNGQSIAQISESFYNAAILYSNLSGYSASMTNSDFVRVIYKNVLGRSGSSAPPDEDVNYWAGELSSGRASKGSLIIAMLNSAHSFLNNPTWGWVAQLLDNKYDVAYQFAIVRGLNFKTPEESIKRTMDIARAITPNDVVVSKRLFEILLAEGTDDFTGDKAELIVSQFGSGSITDDAGLLNCQEQICKAVYKKKSEVKLKAVPATGWKLDRWEGCESESEMTCRVLIQNGKTVHPYFSRTTPPQINADVVVLTDQTINELLSNKDNTLTFSPQATQLLSLTPNNIIVSGKGEGFARRIVSISALSNGDIEVKTKLVGLAEIISEGTFISKQSPTPSQISVVELAKGVKLSPAPAEGAGSTFDLDIKLDDKVSISGKLRVTFNPEWALDFGMFYGLKELKIMLNPTISPDISVVWNGVEIDKKNATKDFSLGIFKLAPIYIQAGPVPIVIVPTFKGYVLARTQI